MMEKIRERWENIYQTKKPDEMSWYQDKPNTSLDLIIEMGLDKNAKIIDVGVGASKLVDNLLALGFRNITALDIASNALNIAKKRLGDKAKSVRWIVSDLREFETNDSYDLWHDRAVLHFLTEKEDISRYVEIVRKFLNPNGYLIVSTFSENGPKRCSGLDTNQYSEESMKRLFSNLDHIKSFEEEHITPWGAKQMFIYSIFRKREDEK